MIKAFICLSISGRTPEKIKANFVDFYDVKLKTGSKSAPRLLARGLMFSAKELQLVHSFSLWAFAPVINHSNFNVWANCQRATKTKRHWWENNVNHPKPKSTSQTGLFHVHIKLIKCIFQSLELHLDLIQQLNDVTYFSREWMKQGLNRVLFFIVTCKDYILQWENQIT